MRQLFEDAAMATRDARSNSVTAQPAVARAEALDWQLIRKDLDEQGSAMLSSVLSAKECRALASLYPDDGLFRSRVVMARHGFGRGEYKYFSYPLPDVIQGLRTALYRRLAPVANQWNLTMGIDVRYPEEHADFVNDAMMQGNFVPPLSFCSMERAITTAFTRIFMENTCFRYRWHSFFLNREEISRAANLCSPNNVRGCNRGRR